MGQIIIDMLGGGLKSHGWSHLFFKKKKSYLLSFVELSDMHCHLGDIFHSYIHQYYTLALYLLTSKAEGGNHAQTDQADL